MSRSMLACAVDTGETTVVRVKSTGPSTCKVTACRTIRYGLDALIGPKTSRAVGKMSDELSQWNDEPVAISISPRKILTLPTWFPAGAMQEERKILSRIEAGFFVNQIDEWSWHTLPLASQQSHPESFEEQIILFFPAEPAQQIETELGRKRKIESIGLHFESLVSLSSGSTAPMAVLELEEQYAAFMVSKGGRAEYFRYWPVNNASEREFFAITELSSSPTRVVKVTGLASDAGTIKRIAAGTSCRIEPLTLPPQVTFSSPIKGTPSPTGVVRAVSTALMALYSSRN